MQNVFGVKQLPQKCGPAWYGFSRFSLLPAYLLGTALLVVFCRSLLTAHCLLLAAHCP
jgi:hypothetical protein